MYAFLQINTYCAAAIRKKQICFIHQRCTEMPRLSENQRNQAITMLQAVAMVHDVAQHFGCSRQTIHNLITMFTITGSVRDRPRPGQRRVTVTTGRPLNYADAFA